LGELFKKGAGTTPEIARSGSEKKTPERMRERLKKKQQGKKDG